MTKKVLIMVAVLLMITGISILFVGCKKQENIEATTFTKEWLDNIKDEAKITQIAIAGSHDSGTIGMTANYCTQNSTVEQQLNLGIRYLDLRVKKQDDNLVIFHDDDIGVDFYGVLDEIKAFMDNHKSEFLILDFQHFANGAEEAVKQALANKGIIDIAVKNESEHTDIDFIDNLTLGDVRGKVVIIWGRDESEDYLFRRNNDGCTMENTVLDSMYDYDLNAKPSEKFVEQSLPIYMKHILQKQKGLTVLQGQLTRGVFNLGGSIISLEKSHNKNMNEYVYKIAENKEQLAKINIIMRDFVEADGKKVNSILYLNFAKGIVKEQLANSYKEITQNN